MPLVIKSPFNTSLSELVGLNIREYHLTRAKQVLALNIAAGDFPVDGFQTFVGSGPAGSAPPPKPGAPFRPPRATTRRDLWAIQPKFIPFPGRIYFENPNPVDFRAAVNLFLNLFNDSALRSGASPAKKGYNAYYARSLVLSVNNRLVQPDEALALVNDDAFVRGGVVLELINIAPHAATIEVDWRIMYDAAILVAEKYSPGITVTYDYINSDQLGLYYGRGTGGPGPKRARDTGRGYPVVYALPRVQIAMNASGFGVSNVRFVTPGRKVSYRVKKKRPTGRMRS